MTEYETNPEEEAAAKEFLKQYFLVDDGWLKKNHPNLIEKEKKGYLATVKNCQRDKQELKEPPNFENTNNFWNYFKKRTIEALRTKLKEIQDDLKRDYYSDNRLRLDSYYGRTLYFWLQEGELILAFEKLGFARSQQMIEDLNFCESSENNSSPDLKTRTARYKESLRRLAVIMHDDLEVPFDLIHL